MACLRNLCPLQHFCPINPILFNSFINTLNKDIEDIPITFTGGRNWENNTVNEEPRFKILFD